MTKFPLVSLIVPVYNVGGYLTECLESAIGQSYRNLEIVVVDDGSTDGSPAICDSFSARDTRVKVIHKPNGGLSSARVAGMNAATGEFVFHLDGDDSLPVDAIKSLVVKQQEGDYDLVFGNFRRCFEDHSEDVVREWEEDRGDYIDRIVTDLGYPHFVWGILIRKSIYDNNYIAPEIGANVGEDLQVLPKLLHYSERIGKIDDVVYNYTVSNATSLTYGKSYGRLLQDVRSVDILREFLREKGYEAECEKLKRARHFMLAYGIVDLLDKISADEFSTLKGYYDDSSAQVNNVRLDLRCRVVLRMPNRLMALGVNYAFRGMSRVKRVLMRR